MKLRWDGLVAYVGQLEVGRIERSKCDGTDVDLWASMLNEFGLSPVGTFSDDRDQTVKIVREGKRMIEDNWKKIEGLLKG